MTDADSFADSAFDWLGLALRSACLIALAGFPGLGLVLNTL